MKIEILVLSFASLLIISCAGRQLEATSAYQTIKDFFCPDGCVNYNEIKADEELLDLYFDRSKVVPGEDIGGLLITKSTYNGKPFIINLDNEPYGMTDRAFEYFQKTGEPIKIIVSAKGPDGIMVIKIKRIK